MQTTFEQLNLIWFSHSSFRMSSPGYNFKPENSLRNYKNLLPFLPNSVPSKIFCILWAWRLQHFRDKLLPSLETPSDHGLRTVSLLGSAAPWQRHCLRFLQHNLASTGSATATSHRTGLSLRDTKSQGKGQNKETSLFRIKDYCAKKKKCKSISTLLFF